VIYLLTYLHLKTVFLVTFRSILTSSEVPKVPNFCQYISGSPVTNLFRFIAFVGDGVRVTVATILGE